MQSTISWICDSSRFFMKSLSKMASLIRSLDLQDRMKANQCLYGRYGSRADLILNSEPLKRAISRLSLSPTRLVLTAEAGWMRLIICIKVNSTRNPLKVKQPISENRPSLVLCHVTRSASDFYAGCPFYYTDHLWSSKLRANTLEGSETSVIIHTTSTA